MSVGGSDDYTVPADLQGGPGKVGGAKIGTVPHCAGAVADGTPHERTAMVPDPAGFLCPVCGLVEPELPIPEGCAALWHAESSAVDPKAVMEQASRAAHRTHKDQAVLMPDGTIKIVSAELFGGVTSF